MEKKYNFLFVAKGTGAAGTEILGKIHVKEIYEIAKVVRAC